MAFPQPSHAGSHAQHRPGARPAGIPSPVGYASEGDHQLEKLEFAMAVACSRGDASRCEALAQQIAALGGNLEEPGT